MQAKTIVYAYVRMEYSMRSVMKYTNIHSIMKNTIFIYLFINLTDSCADNLWACYSLHAPSSQNAATCTDQQNN